QVARLDDGTRLTLDTASAVDVRYSQTERVVRLRAGRVFFTIAADARPFEVVAGPVVIRDIGTAFSVDRDGDDVRVAVRQGEVALAPDGQGAPPRSLRAGEAGGYRDGRLTAPARIDPQIAFAWLDHHLFFQQRPLWEVVDELRRYYRGWIIIATPALRDLKVSGGYNLDDPVAAVRDLARLSGASLVSVSDRLLILR
ncbi:MAG TPA: FecR domain-containing protein, partial [Rhodopila sp.]|uniref:FecR family protein n=1 Tax=Rhodopila sp. TaxID=2480087 RepID=UPI002CE999CF